MTTRSIPQLNSNEDITVDIWEIRSRLIDKGLIYYALISLPMMLVPLLRIIEFGYHPIYLFHMILALCSITIAMIRKHLPFTVRASWFLLTAFSVGLFGMWVFGPFSGSIISICIFPILVAIVIGLRASLLAILVCISLITIFGIGAVQGSIDFAYDSSYINRPSTWVSYIALFLFWVPVTAIALGVIHTHLVKSLSMLQKSQGYRKRLFESSKVPTLVLEVSNYFIVDCNPAAVEVFGFAFKDQLLGKTPSELSPITQPDGRLSEEGVRSYVNEALEKGNKFIEWRHQRNEGELWDAEVHLMSFVSEGQNLVQCAVTDITRRKKIEEELIQSRTRYKSLFDNANDAIFTIVNGCFVECNSKTEKMFRCTKEELLGKGPLYFSPERQPDGSLSTVKAQEKVSGALNGKPQYFEWQHTRADGTLFDADVSLSSFWVDDTEYILAIVRDITEKKRADEQLHRFALVIEQADEIVIITDTNGIITYVNPAFEAVTGYTRDEAIGQNPNIQKSGLVSDATYRELWHTIKSGSTWKGQFINKKKDDSLYTEEATISPLRSPTGEILSYVGVKRDISRELALENRINQAQKMEAIGALAGGIAHDFNNILGAIMGYTELAMLDSEKNSEALPSLQEVAKASQRAKDLVSQILTFSRQTERNLKPQRIHPIAKEVLKLLRASIPSTVEIRHNIDSFCAAVIADSTETHQILMNLCTNAYQALPESGGIIEVSLSEIDVCEDEAQDFPNMEAGRYVRISVADNGYGMDESTKSRIFEPYFTTKERGEGTGLGLATVHGIVQGMNGFIRVYSEKGAGTTFNILLPAIDSDEKIAKKGFAGMESLSGNENVLVVDDEEAIAHFARIALTKLGYNITIQTSSIEALDLFRKDPAAFDVVITDQMMPRMRGTELSRELVTIRPDIPIIMCSGFGDVLNAEGKEGGAIKKRVMKPVVVADLAVAIRAVLDVKQDTQPSPESSA